MGRVALFDAVPYFSHSHSAKNGERLAGITVSTNPQHIPVDDLPRVQRPGESEGECVSSHFSSEQAAGDIFHVFILARKKAAPNND